MKLGPYARVLRDVLREEPSAILRYTLGGKSALDRDAFRRVCGSNLPSFQKELIEDPGHLGDALSELKMLPYLGWVDAAGAEILYGIVRALAPRTVVETGVAAGVSTAHILAALSRNGAGELHSIDLPNNEMTYLPSLGIEPVSILPPGKSPGFLVPDALKSRWRFHLGDSRVVLPKLLEDLQPISMFFHDSEHTYEAMSFEYEVAWKHLAPGGLLLSDDVRWNRAFADFCERHRVAPTYFWARSLAAVTKPSR